jgi:Icc-related predicted phosphoesterase
MKVAYASDVHVEFGPIEIYNTKKADVLILAGDIIVADKLFDKGERHYLDGREFKVSMNDRYHGFFEQVCEEFKDVIYILGNHEHYNGDFPETLPHIKEKLSYLKNLHILEKEKFVLEDVIFLCGTMWTDFNNGDSDTMDQIRRRMNDFQLVKNTSKVLQDGYLTPYFSPQDAYKEHLAFLEFSKEELANEDNRKVVMVTHHCPSSICIPKKYAGQTVMNPGYVSKLDDFILDNPKIKAWVCGHSHRTLDRMIGSTEILMNCRGYDGYEPMADDFELKYFEV